jgi:hypothetical protein
MPVARSVAVFRVVDYDSGKRLRLWAVFRVPRNAAALGEPLRRTNVTFNMTTREESKRRSVVPLIEGEHDDVQVIRLDGDRFVTTAQQAIDFLSLAGRAVAFQQQLKELLDRIYKWIDDRKQKIAAGYIVFGGDGITVVIVQRDVRFDFAFEDELTDLDLEVANSGSFPLIPFNTLLVPKVGDTALKSFLSSGQIVRHKVNAEQE